MYWGFKPPLRRDLTSTDVLISAVLDLWTRADLCRSSIGTVDVHRRVGDHIGHSASQPNDLHRAIAALAATADHPLNEALLILNSGGGQLGATLWFAIAQRLHFLGKPWPTHLQSGQRGPELRDETRRSRVRADCRGSAAPGK